MKKRAFVIVILLVAAAVLASLTIRKSVPSAPPDHVVRSDDGTAELRIPAGALPEGVAIDAVSVTRVIVESDGLMAKYDLRPSGLVFARPATFVMRLPLPPQPAELATYVDVPTVVLQDDGGIGGAVHAELAIDYGRGETVVSAPITHFSSITAMSFLAARIDRIGDKLVNQPFMAGARVTQTRTEVRVPIAGDPVNVAYVYTGGAPYLQTGRLLATEGVLSPELVDKVPQNKSVEAVGGANATYGVVRSYSCQTVGDAQIRYLVFADLEVTALVADAQDRRTPIDFDQADTATEIRLETPQFRCLTAVDDSGPDVIIDGGGETEARKTVINAAKGMWEAEVRTSGTKVPLGGAFTVDVILTDVTDRLLETVNEPERYRTNWEARGTWHITEGIYDRGPTVDAARREAPYGARLTYRLPMRCERPGVGPISLELEIGRVLQPTPSLLPGIAARVDVRLPAVYVECVGPTEPPTEPKKEPIRLNPTTLEQVHKVGSTRCPQELGTVKVDVPPGSTWTADGIPDWITMPSSGGPGDVRVLFNCGIANYEAHSERATITFTSGGQSAAAEVTVNVR